LWLIFDPSQVFNYYFSFFVLYLSYLEIRKGKEFMCLGIPMQIQEINQFMARCEAKGIERDVSLFMMQDEPLQVGDYVVVHVGYAIQKMTETEAISAWQIYDEMLALEDEAQRD